MPEELVVFEDFVFDRSTYELRRSGTVVSLQRIPFELLSLLIERRGQLVTREEILERVWGKGVFVDTENAINTAVLKLRRALGDNPEAPRFILTMPARGYRFVAHTRRPNVVGAGHFRARGLDAMVGRERELRSLMSGLDETLAGHGRMVFLVSGEPGIGKTRLADEFAAVAEAKGLAVRIGHCFQEAVPFLPFVEMLERLVDGIAEPEQLRRQLGEEASELARLLPKLRRILPDLPPALDLPPLQARRHLFNCFFDFVARSANEQPTLMIVEDLHWADDSSLALLDHLAQRIADLPVMLLGTYRDAEIDVTRGLAKTLEDLLRGRIATRLKLKGLPRDDVATMLSRLSGKSAPAEVVEEIFAETEGNPFFVEELFRHLDEEHRLYNSAGEFHSSLKIAELEVPDSVRLVVARRLERLDETTRRMLATAATIGRFFSFELLEAASGTDGDSLMECIAEAEGAGLVYSLTEVPKARFQFSHELVRQAVISRLSSALRQKLHLEVAEAIERICSRVGSKDGASNDDRVAELAYHYAHGGNPDKAVEYCVRAVHKFSWVGSSTEALAQFHSGLELLRDLPDGDRRAEIELDLRNAVLGAIGDAKGYASLEAEQSYARAMEICQRPGIHWEKTWVARSGMFFVQQLRPNLRKAEAITNDLIAVAQRHDDIGRVAEAENWSAYTSMVSGAFEAAASTFDRAWTRLESFANPSLTQGRHPDLADWQRALLTPQGLTIWGNGTLQNNRILAGWNLWFLGYPDGALDRLNSADAIAQHPEAPKNILADIHGFATYIYELRREPAQMKARAAARLALANEEGYFTGRAIAEIYLGWAHALAGALEGGTARMRASMAQLKSGGSEYITDRGLGFVASALGRAGRFEEALATLEEAFPFIERTGQRYYQAELHRLKGELLVGHDTANAAAAEQSFHTALEISREQRAKSWELRATVSLARLLRDTGRRDEARAMLAEIYNWFTEGFDTADLKDAKALLDELSQ